MSRDNPFLALPLLMLLAFVLCLCSEADAFLAASFTTMSLSAKLAFLVFGPMLDIKLLLMYTRVFRPRLIVVIVSCVAVQVLAYTMLAHFPLLEVKSAPVPVKSLAPTADGTTTVPTTSTPTTTTPTTTTPTTTTPTGK